MSVSGIGLDIILRRVTVYGVCDVAFMGYVVLCMWTILRSGRVRSYGGRISVG